MDQATQQNAALVEQSAAAAESLKTQAKQLVEAVAVFKLSGQGRHVAAFNTATPAANASPGERRGSTRAKNVARPASSQSQTPNLHGARHPTYRSVPMPRPTDDWASF